MLIYFIPNCRNRCVNGERSICLICCRASLVGFHGYDRSNKKCFRCTCCLIIKHRNKDHQYNITISPHSVLTDDIGCSPVAIAMLTISGDIGLCLLLRGLSGAEHRSGMQGWARYAKSQRDKGSGRRCAGGRVGRPAAAGTRKIYCPGTSMRLDHFLFCVLATSLCLGRGSAASMPQYVFRSVVVLSGERL